MLAVLVEVVEKWRWYIKGQVFVVAESISLGSRTAHAVPNAVADADRAILQVVHETIQLEESNWQCKDCGHRSETVLRRERDVGK